MLVHRTLVQGRNAFRAAPSRGTVTVVAAKKGGKKDGGKKGANQKGGGALAGLMKKKEEAVAAKAAEEAAAFAKPEQYKDPDLVFTLLDVCQSYWKSTGKYLLEDVSIELLAEALYKAPFGVIVDEVGAADAPEPQVVYANRAVLELLGRKWEEVVEQQAAAAYSLEKQDDVSVLNLGGGKALVKSPVVVQLQDQDEVTGRLLIFEEYELPDGTVAKVQGELPPKPEDLPEGAADDDAGDDDDAALFPDDDGDDDDEAGKEAA